MSFRIPYHGAGIALLKSSNDSLEIFMGKRSRHPFIKCFSIPGGSLEKSLNEDEISAAKREFKEETGLEFSKLDCTYLGKWEKVLPFFKWTTFFYLTENKLTDAIPNEFYYLKWINFEKLDNYLLRPFTKHEMKKGLMLFTSYKDHR